MYSADSKNSSMVALKPRLSSTGFRVFPTAFKAAPLLRGWVRSLRDAGMRDQFAFHPFGGDVAAEGGDEEMLLAAGEEEIARVVEVAQVAGGDERRVGVPFAQVAAPARALHQDFAVGRECDADMGQGLADAAGAVLQPVRPDSA